jgi:hypothetical protein
MYEIGAITPVQILSTSAPKLHDECMIFSTALFPNVWDRYHYSGAALEYINPPASWQVHDLFYSVGL